MSDESSSTPPPPPTETPKPVDTFKPTWKLPEGIEDDLTMGIIHTAAGVTIGGLTGLLLFKAGKGNRAASVATGLGVAIGSTYERAVAKAAASQD